ADLLERIGGHALLRRVEAREIELCLPVELGLLAVDGPRELGQLSLRESDLRLTVSDDLEVGGIVFLEGGRALWPLVDHRDDRLVGRWRWCGGRGGGRGRRGIPWLRGLVRRFGAGSHGDECGQRERRAMHGGLRSKGYARHDCTSTSGLTRPARNVLPVATLVSQTSAGLNSSGSIL